MNKIYLFLLFLIVLLINNSIPFVQVPGFGIVLWEVGFAQSIANHSLLFPFATDFGLPNPAPIAFGLPAVWPMSVLIRVGLPPADAYTTINALWLAIAFWGAFSLCRRWANNVLVSGLGAAVWLTLPMVWFHQPSYGALALGFALLPTYLYAGLCFFESSGNEIPASALGYLFLTVIALFMDGYTFVMFGVLASGMASFILWPQKRNRATLFRLGWHGLSFVLAYILYTLYVGFMPMSGHPQSVFHAMGMDLSFWLLPSKGMLWLADALHISVPRSSGEYWGDRSIWASFYLPVFCAGCWAFWRVRHNKIAICLLIIALFAFWMSLGPILKINSMVPNGWSSYSPPAEGAGYLRTGNNVLRVLPGFSAMRAAYRWGGLCALAMWGLMMLAFSTSLRKNMQPIWLIALILFQIPAPTYTERGRHVRNNCIQFDREFVSTCRNTIHHDEIVALIPRYNDFIINYASARTPFFTYNIGGDKNIALASMGWPDTLKQIPMGVFDIKAVIQILQKKEADVVMIPFFPTVNTGGWPVSSKKYYNSLDKWMSQLHILADHDQIILQHTPYFVLVRLADGFSDGHYLQMLQEAAMALVKFPILPDHRNLIPEIFRQGWYASEKTHIWSSANAELILPPCSEARCWRLNFSVFDASLSHPKEIVLVRGEGEKAFNLTMTITENTPQIVDIPIGDDDLPQTLTIKTIGATSPQECDLSNDTRILGIALYSIDLVY